MKKILSILLFLFMGCTACSKDTEAKCMCSDCHCQENASNGHLTNEECKCGPGCQCKPK